MRLKYLLTACLKAGLGPLTVLFISFYLDPVGQGGWYFLVSLSVIIGVADLGLTVSITQALSKVKDQYDKKFSETELGEIKFILSSSISRLLGVLCVGNLLTYCIMVFLDNSSVILYVFPYFGLYFVSVSIHFLFVVITSVFEGIGLMGLSLNSKILQSVSYAFSVWVFLSNGFDYFTYVIALFLSAVLSHIYLFVSARNFFNELFVVSQKFTPFAKMQRKLSYQYLISYAAGFVIVQSIILQAKPFFSLEVIGELGMSLAIVSAIFAVSTSMASHSIPFINNSFGPEKMKALHMTFTQTKTAAYLFISCFSGVMLLYILTDRLSYFGIRLVGEMDMLLLGIFFLLHTLINSLAVFIRASGKDELVIPTGIQACAVLVFNYLSFSSGSITTALTALSVSNAAVFLFCVWVIRRDWI